WGEVKGTYNPCPRRPQGGQALVDLADALLCLPLHGQSPPMRYDPPCGMRKPLLVTEHDESCGPLLYGPGVVQEQIEPGIEAPGQSRGIRVCTLLSQGQRRATPCQRLVWIAQHPQDISQIRKTSDPSIPSIVRNE